MLVTCKMVFLAAFILLFVQADVASSYSVYKYVHSPPYKYAPYKYVYPYPPPPPPPPHHTHVYKPLPHVHKNVAHHPKQLKAAVTGHVYCDTCKDGKFKEPLKGVMVGVICRNGKVERSFYGVTNKLGNFKVKLGGYNYHKHKGTKSCHVKLISPSYSTSCMVPTNLHGGKLGAHLQIKSKNLHELVLKAGPFSYTSPFKNKKCYQDYGKSPSFYKHGSKHSHVHAKHESPSCPAYKCKSTTPPYKHESLQLITNKHKHSPPLHGTHKALPPNPHTFMYPPPPPPIYLRYKKKS